jgi:predicted glycosyl hydrolase (DUF1957 family)
MRKYIKQGMLCWVKATTNKQKIYYMAIRVWREHFLGNFPTPFFVTNFVSTQGCCIVAGVIWKKSSLRAIALSNCCGSDQMWTRKIYIRKMSSFSLCLPKSEPLKVEPHWRKWYWLENAWRLLWASAAARIIYRLFPLTQSGGRAIKMHVNWRVRESTLAHASDWACEKESD